MSMSAPPEDPRFREPMASRRGVPLATYPVPPASRLRVVPCIHCGNEIGVSRWDHLNGFLVQCPHCLGFHGRRRGLQFPLIAGVLLNVLSFFFLMRPKRALQAILGLGAFVTPLVIWSGSNMENEAPGIVAIGAIILGPVLINAVVLVRHQVLLDRPPPAIDEDAQ